MQHAMRLIVAAATASGATELVPIEMAHIGSSHYTGRLSLDFAEFLLAEGATLAVPTHTNASLVSCSSPDLRPEALSPTEVAGSHRVMAIYESLGCSAMWSCAPYQQPEGRPSFGQHIVGSESNAVAFVNSVLGARTNKYGDFLDVSAAMVGRVPLSGLHTDAGRRATHVFDCSELDCGALADPSFAHLLGVAVAREAGSRVPAIEGIAAATEDELKALASAAAAAGGVSMFHVVGVTPEAPTTEEACHGAAPTHRTAVTGRTLSEAARFLTSASGDEPLRAVCLGTPHFSVDEFSDVVGRLAGRRVAAGIRFIITTSRAVAAELQLRGLDATLAEAGVDVVVDTCTYFPPRPSGLDGLTLTNSAKWAYYGQGLLDVPIGFTSLERCVESAVSGAWIR